ncbi:Oxaloacetate decarboxylase Na(+) pump, gamma chain (EC 4.1.1.3) [uncultured Gammaproteobacteria bacterium]|jgi:oxaloacetate decarboxylase gamma subunit|nr:Oxaloacetate decarboxylase Na(+) pump, gamma chain (EC [Bathymodiolus brooksi thiotrophic gill symbiont]CAC9591248.1 Oxaloacetate decarboxylase Na(+) pump, gamma chain (EC 4.1.1.3) [uncultured Gammaproteobacteria bacterium]CAB9542508.1 Oxaloacetate decarboxylase Na(+) pump, gamma chain (EC [Bathymodiolus brooksi thiotrophic gill symbiont]CAC9607111.1 Oxaloacetate decarboxylase Na(+) pump, gamma chain (EC 4.1.1.3) [uncultured Gammaproteobacteria bacterium]CAC9617810.1 Oxaloacetate decarboxyla
MEQVDLIAEALNLTLFGMGFVFLFLTLLVFVTKLMSIIIQRINRQASVAVNGMDDELDEETKFVIEEAIKIHRGA